MSKIELSDTPIDIMVKMSAGNPGAASVLAGCFKYGEIIDPEAMLGGLNTFIWMDELKLYGSNIWVLFKYVCGQDLYVMIALIRAFQLGLLPKADLWRAVESQSDEGLDVAGLVAKVEKKLPKFQRLSVPEDVR